MKLHATFDYGLLEYAVSLHKHTQRFRKLFRSRQAELIEAYPEIDYVDNASLDDMPFNHHLLPIFGSGNDLTGEFNHYTAWQEDFTSLKELRLVAIVPSHIGQGTQDMLEQLPEQARILMRAEKVIVDIAVLSCEAAWWTGEMCSGQCVGIVERAIAGLTRD